MIMKTEWKIDNSFLSCVTLFDGVLVFYIKKMLHKYMETWACLFVVNKSWFGKCFLSFVRLTLQYNKSKV